jgi:hypothetical protein
MDMSRSNRNRRMKSAGNVGNVGVTSVTLFENTSKNNQLRSAWALPMQSNAR